MKKSILDIFLDFIPNYKIFAWTSLIVFADNKFNVSIMMISIFDRV